MFGWVKLAQFIPWVGGSGGTFLLAPPPLCNFEVLCGDDLIEYIRGHGDINSGAWSLSHFELCVPVQSSKLNWVSLFKDFNVSVYTCAHVCL